MLMAERRAKLGEILSRRRISDLETLAGELRVSQSTVRRDIEAMERQGLVRRTHGGVIWESPGDRGGGGLRPYAFDQRLGQQVEAKVDIACAAAKLVQSGQTVLIDGGTTTFQLAARLVGRPLQIVTNSLPIAELFSRDEHVELIVTGGLMYPRYGVLLGPLTENMLNTIHTQTMFLSVAGIHEGGLYNQNMLLVGAERKMMERTQQVILLADSSKFGQQALAHLCGLEQIDVVVSDRGLSEDHRREVREAGCELVIAGREVS